jgi:hypothetical protein
MTARGGTNMARIYRATGRSVPLQTSCRIPTFNKALQERDAKVMRAVSKRKFASATSRAKTVVGLARISRARLVASVRQFERIC